MRYTLFVIFIFSAGFKSFSQDFTPFFKAEGQEKTKLVKEWMLVHLHHPDSAAKNLPVFKQLLKEATIREDAELSLLCRFYFDYIQVVILRNEKEYLPELDRLIAEASQTSDPYLYADFLQSTGMVYYYVEKQYAKGLEYMLRAHEEFAETGYERIIDASLRLYELAHVYYELGNYEKCLELLLPAIHYPRYDDTYSRLQVLNTLGMAYLHLDKPDSALHFFTQTLSLAKAKGDAAWIGIASVNIGKYYLQKGMYTEGAPYVHAGYQNIRLNDDRLSERDAAEVLLLLAQLEIKNGKPDKGLHYIWKAETYLKSNKLWYKWNRNDDLYAELYWMLSEVYDKKKDARNAFKYGTLAGQYNDSIAYFKDQAKYAVTHTQVEAETQVHRLKQLAEKKKQLITYRNFSISVLLLLALLLFSLYKIQRIRNRKNKELFIINERLLQSEKLRAEEQLRSFIETLHSKNHMIEQFEHEIELLKQLPTQSKKLQTIETLQNLQKITIITDDDWVHFKELFDKVYPGFLVRLKEKYPEATPAEMRLLALVKLDIPTKAMANMLGISPESIRKTGYRFLKKITDTGENNLREIVASI